MVIKSYDLFARALHSIMAIIIIYTLIAGFASHLVSKYVFDILSVLNMSFATIAIPLFILRYFWSFFRVTPNLPKSIPNWQKQFAKLFHSLLYLIILSVFLSVFLSGFLMLKQPFQFFWLFRIQNPVSDTIINTFFFKAHISLCFLLAAMVLVHILAVIKHHFYNKNNVVELMFPASK